MNVVINKTLYLFQQSTRQTLRLQVRLRLEAGDRILGQGVEHPGHRGRAKVLWQHHNLQMKTSTCDVALCGDLTMIGQMNCYQDLFTCAILTVRCRTLLRYDDED